MGNLAIAFGTLLILLGAGAFGLTRAPTALIPAGFGVVLGLLGYLARKEHLRMHVMHAAVLLALVGAIVPAVRAIPHVAELANTGSVVKIIDGQPKEMKYAVIAQLIMASLCAVFTVLCVMSFIKARRVRKINS